MYITIKSNCLTSICIKVVLRIRWKKCMHFLNQTNKGALNLSKIFKTACGFIAMVRFWRSVSCLKFFPRFFSPGYALPVVVQSKVCRRRFAALNLLLNATLRLGGHPASQKAPTMDLELAHYQQRVSQREKKNGEKFEAWDWPQMKNRCYEKN